MVELINMENRPKDVILKSEIEEKENKDKFGIETIIVDINNALSVVSVRDLFYSKGTGVHFGTFEEVKIFEKNLDLIIGFIEEAEIMEDENKRTDLYIKISELINELPNKTELQKITVSKIKELVLKSMFRKS